MMSSSPANASSPLNATSAPIPGAAVGLALLSVAVVVGLPGNAMVLWSCAVTHRRSVPVLLIFHLALADVVTLLTGPVYLRALSVGQWNMGLAICRGCNYLCAAAMYVSIFLIALLGLHRCLAVSKPATAVVSAGGHAGQLAHGAAAVTWLVALVLAIPSIVFRRVEHGHCQRVHSTEAWLVVHNLLETILGWALPLTAVAAGYGLLIRRLRQTRLARRSRTFRLVAAVVVAFAVAWGPYHLASLLEVAVVVRGGGGTLEVAAKAIRPPATALAFLSSAMNPLLYACAGRRLCRGSGGSLLPRLLEVSAIAGSSRGTTTKRERRSWRGEEGRRRGEEGGTTVGEEAGVEEGGVERV
ncbi:leukotriene B4 receptor 1-like [Haliaeetus albicilla]|uniref:leukotriene B4 receptor 1-like n=1 Tax=Haliaeetus albicilla TaxID=8969 RepID=UPI0037E901E2